MTHDRTDRAVCTAERVSAARALLPALQAFLDTFPVGNEACADVRRRMLDLVEVAQFHARRCCGRTMTRLRPMICPCGKANDD